jgi:ATP-dependent helicase/nuclease subunit A
MKLVDESGFSLITTPMHSLIASKLYEECVEEEIRVLYVALTRARERLYISGTTKTEIQKIKEKNALRRDFVDNYTVLTQCKSYLDWILLALGETEYDFSELEYLTPENITLALDSDAEAEPDSTENSAVIDEKMYSSLQESFKFSYPYAELSHVPSKLSVSRLYPDILDEFDTSCDLFIDERPATVPEFFSSVKATKSSAERGTATHLFLQFCNFEYAATHGIREELSRLCALKFLPPSVEELIYVEELEKFLDSELLIEILSAKKIIREQRFNISLDPQGFTKDEALIEKMLGESLAVQGVIDLILVTKDDKIKLYDYKTDRLTKDELTSVELAKETLSSKHSNQLSYYAMACEKMFGKKCDSVQIYSTHAARLYDIEV